MTLRHFVQNYQNLRAQIINKKLKLNKLNLMLINKRNKLKQLVEKIRI